MSNYTEITSEKQTIEGSLSATHSRLKTYTNDQITILDDIISTIEAFYKTEKYAQEKMQGSLQKSLEHTQNMSYLGPSVIGTSWNTALKELMEHYTQREASHPVLKQVVLENLRKIKAEKLEELHRVILYDEEILKEMIDIERRTMKSRRAYDEACERLRQHLNPVKEKKSSIERLQQKILPKNELERLEGAVVDTRNLYILNVSQMNYALTLYFEQFIVDIDKLLVCDIFQQIQKALDDLVYSEYKRLHDVLQRAIQIAINDGEEQKRRLLPQRFQTYPLSLSSEHNDQLNTEEKHLSQLHSIYHSALNEVREADQQIQTILETSALNAQQNKDVRADHGKIRLKRIEMHKSIATYLIENLESLVPNIKTGGPSRVGLKSMSGLKSLITPMKIEVPVSNVVNPLNDSTVALTSVDTETKQVYANTNTGYPCQAIVLYDFEAANEDEMSVKKDEKIFIEAKTEDAGWLIARGRGRSGLVPETYVQILAPNNFPTDPNLVNATVADNQVTLDHQKTRKSSTPMINEDAEEFSDED